MEIFNQSIGLGYAAARKIHAVCLRYGKKRATIKGVRIQQQERLGDEPTPDGEP